MDNVVDRGVHQENLQSGSMQFRTVDALPSASVGKSPGAR